jgi:hypothetical protein
MVGDSAGIESKGRLLGMSTPSDFNNSSEVLELLIWGIYALGEARVENRKWTAKGVST